jgi:hypothetical protein
MTTAFVNHRPLQSKQDAKLMTWVSSEAERLKQSPEAFCVGHLIGKPPLPMRGKLLDEWPGKGMITHVVQGGVVDDRVGATARSRSRKFSRLLLPVVPDQAKL